MRKIGFVVLGLVVLVAFGQAAKLDKANITKNAKFVAHLDLDAFRASTIGATIFKKIREDEGQDRIDALAELVGFDPLNALHHATMSGNGEDDNGVIVVKHRMDDNKLLAFMKLDKNYRETKHGKFKIHGVGDREDDERGYISFVNENSAVLASSRKLAGKGIDLVNGKGEIKKIPDQLEVMAKKAKHVFFVAHANVQEISEIDDENIRQWVKGAGVLFGESDNKIVLFVNVNALNMEAAENIENMINGLIGFAKFSQNENPDIQTLLRGMNVKRDETNVSIQFSMSVDKMFEMIDPALKQIDIDLPMP